jgi:hypothetical protein
MNQQELKELHWLAFAETMPETDPTKPVEPAE